MQQFSDRVLLESLWFNISHFSLLKKNIYWIITCGFIDETLETTFNQSFPQKKNFQSELCYKREIQKIQKLQQQEIEKGK